MTTIIKLYKKEEVGDVLQRLKDSGVKTELSFSPDVPGTFKILNKSNEYHENTLNPCRIDWHKVEEVISALAYEASIVYPESPFAEWYEHQLRVPQ